ncbi:MAG: carbamate kinase [Deltaproteobacteria bacterium CG07_land_8_20_14_0_80_38_7]|nr:MAG: carbamate kinase [Deltaproteobacteria bacterium CG07_land_8_20_14_0_80_38_7]
MGNKPGIAIALGGNAISKPGLRGGGVAEQFYSTHESMEHVAALVSEGYERILITHGNGPQVGSAILRSEFASKIVYPLPLDMCVAETQGEMGYMIQQVLNNCLRERGINKSVVTVVTQVYVDVHDKAFERPSKPIGQFYTEKEAKELMAAKDWNLKEDSGRGWRRMVASPKPIDVVEKDVIKTLFDKKNIVIAGGGGGVPIGRNRYNKFYGVEAVIDKDLTSALLASEINADILLIMTGVEYAYVDFRGKSERALSNMTVEEMELHLANGEFADGSMKPKIEACLNFLKNGGKEAIITSIPKCLAALRGKTGTHIKL